MTSKDQPVIRIQVNLRGRFVPMLHKPGKVTEALSSYETPAEAIKAALEYWGNNYPVESNHAEG